MMTAEMYVRNSTAPDAAANAASVQDFEMQVQVTGDGRPLVLVGGGLTGWKSWEPHAERLAATRTVARLQLLNVEYGLENHALPDAYSARVESAAMKATLDGLRWYEPLDLVAWSYGALVALDFALNHPDRVRTLTLIEPPAAWVLPDKGLNDPDVQALRSLDLGNDVSEAELEAFLRMASLIPAGVARQGLPQWPVWMEHRRSLRSPVNPLDHDDDPQRLRTFEQPVLLAKGAGTAPYYGRIIETLVAQLPRARAVEMPAGHAPHIISMDRFLHEVAEFHRSAAGVEDVNPAIMQKTTSNDGTVISFLKRGTGRPLLFVHGMTTDHMSWSKVSSFLEQDFTVYAMDRRGRGASGDASDYELTREAEDVAAVVDAIGEPVILVEHSFGGLCSLEAALLTENISRLVLYEPPLPGVSTLAPDVAGRIEELVDRGEWEAAMEMTLRDAAGIPDHELEAYRRTPLWGARIPLATTVPRELSVEWSYHFDAEKFARLDVSTTLLLGGDSPQAYRRAVETLDSVLPNSQVVILPGQQHLAHHTDPKMLARELRSSLLE